MAAGYISPVLLPLGGLAAVDDTPAAGFRSPVLMALGGLCVLAAVIPPDVFIADSGIGAGQASSHPRRDNNEIEIIEIFAVLIANDIL